MVLTISPFKLIGGSQETMTFVFDAGIAFMSCGADGTKIKYIFSNINPIYDVRSVDAISFIDFGSI